MNTTLRSPWRTAGTYGVLLLGAMVTLFPFLVVVFTAFKNNQQLFGSAPWAPPSPPTAENFTTILGEYGFLRFMATTALVALVMAVGQIVFSMFAAYAFARMEFPGRDVLFWLYLATLMVPNVVTLIPLFIITQHLGLIDTFPGLVLPYVLGTPYGIFLLRQYFLTIPKDLEAAARIDGAGTLRTFFLIILPLSKPIMATLGIITIVQAWNNYLWPLVVSSSESTRVVTVAAAALNSNFSAQYGLTMAVALLATLPLLVLYLVFQRHVVRSIALSGIK